MGIGLCGFCFYDCRMRFADRTYPVPAICMQPVVRWLVQIYQPFFFAQRLSLVWKSSEFNSVNVTQPRSTCCAMVCVSLAKIESASNVKHFSECTYVAINVMRNLIKVSIFSWPIDSSISFASRLCHKGISKLVFTCLINGFSWEYFNPSNICTLIRSRSITHAPASACDRRNFVQTALSIEEFDHARTDAFNGLVVVQRNLYRKHRYTIHAADLLLVGSGRTPPNQSGLMS